MPSLHYTRVINMRDSNAVENAKRQGVFIRIDRATKFGNPFSHKTAGTLAKYYVETREEAVASYRDWVQSQPELMANLYELKDKVLGCWCKPLACHGDVLAELADALDDPSLPADR